MSWETLAFEERQRQWVGHRRCFRQLNGRGKRPSVWEIEVLGNRVHTKHGLLDGAMQETDYLGKTKNAGKANEISDIQDAIADARRDVRKKWDFGGYDEYVEDKNIDCRNVDVSIQSLLTNLPGSFCLYKPENNLLDQKKLLTKARAHHKDITYTFKRDGVAKWVVVDFYGNIQIYSRRSRPWQDKEGPTELPDGTLDFSTVIPWSARFPHLVEAVRQLGLPPGTMMACELTLPGEDNFPFVSGLTKGYTERALTDMEVTGKYPSLYWWDVPFYGGEDLVSTTPASQRYATIITKWTLARHNPDVLKFIQPIQLCDFPSPEVATDYAKEKKFEGWVVVDLEAVYGDKGWNLKGKPDRPASCAKLKPRFEDDFVAMWNPDKGVGNLGTGKHERGKLVTLPDGSQVTHGGVGSVSLFQWNSKKELIPICDCSSGMDFSFQARLSKSDFPMTWQVEYVERTYKSEGDKTNALRFPTFVRVREDKKPEECVNDRL